MKRIIKGDTVKVIAGKYKNQQGNVLQVFPKEQKAIVEGINKVKRHQKSKNNEPGTIIEKEAPIALCKLTLVDPKIKTGTIKVTYQIDPKTNKKVRLNRKTNSPISSKK